MIRKIKYVFDKQPDHFTCHALFSKITNGELANKNINSYTKQPRYKVSLFGRSIDILVDESDIKIIDELPNEIFFIHKGEQIKAVLFKDEYLSPIKLFNNGDFVTASGLLLYVKKDATTGKTICPINPIGKFVVGQRDNFFNFLEDRLGLDLKTQVDTREFRFELISYKHFDSGRNVYSQSNNNKLSLQGVISIDVKGYVVDADKTNNLLISSIGKKRSYGFGDISVTK